MATLGQRLSGLWAKARGTLVPDLKASAVGALMGPAGKTAWISFGSPRWTGRSYELLLREGYRKNVVVNRCVKILAESAASVPLLLYRGEKEIAHHPLLDLLARPNPLQSGQELIANLVAFLEIAGNGYLEAVEGADGRVMELYCLRPDRMKIIPGDKGWPEGFEYKVGSQSHLFPVDAKTGRSPVLHLKTLNPEDDWYGLSSLEAAAYSIDVHNAASGWNKALLDNAARPSGALVFEPAEGTPGSLSEEQFARLKNQLEENYQGAANAGRPFLLEGGLKWQPMAMTPQDMEFIALKNTAAREIALAFGVPPMILGIPGDNTYSNYQEANRALWKLTLLPLLERLAAGLNSWLAPAFGMDLRLDFDRDEIPAISFERDLLWNRIGMASFLTQNEKRELLGFTPLEEASPLPAAEAKRRLKKKTLGH